MWGAWIEIDDSRIIDYYDGVSHPTRGAWIEILSMVVLYAFIGVAPHTGCVD